MTGDRNVNHGENLIVQRNKRQAFGVEVCLERKIQGEREYCISPEQ